MAFKDVEVGRYAYAAGVTRTDRLAIAIAIAKLESGFDPNAKADDSDDLSYGLWQINMKGALGPERRAKFGLSNNEQLFDPATNARVMASLSNKGENWSAWSTWSTVRAQGLMAVYLPTAIAVASGTAGAIDAAQGAVDAAQGASDGVAAIGTATKATYNWVSDRNNWFRVMKVVAGAALLVGGLYLATRPIVGEQVEKVVQVASKVATKGKG